MAKLSWPPALAILLALLASTLLLLVRAVLHADHQQVHDILSTTGHSSNNLKVEISHGIARDLLDVEAKKATSGRAAIAFPLVRRQFHVSAGAGNSSHLESEGGAKDGQTGVYKLNPQLLMAMQATARRIQQVKDLIDASRNRGSQKIVSSSGGQTVTIADPGNEQYIVKIGLGTPCQEVELSLEPSGRWVWVFDSSYPGCYDSSASSSHAEVGCWDSQGGCETLEGSCQDGKCRYDHQLSDGSHSGGLVVSDTATIVTADKQDLVVNSLFFGISDTVSGFEGRKGVLGLGRSASSFTSQLAASSGMSASFATCLPSWDATWETGKIFFGSWNSPSGSELSYTSMLTSNNLPDLYYVRLVCLQVAGAIVDVPDGVFDMDPYTGYGGLFLDAGVTFTQLVPDAYNALLNEMRKWIAYPGAQVNDLELCYDTSSDGDSPRFPTLTFVFDGGVQMDFPADSVFVKAVSGNDQIRCLGIQQMDNFNILGSVQQQNFLIEYNTVNCQIGWRGPVQCANE